MTGASTQPFSSYLRPADFANSDDYAAYVRDNIAIGITPVNEF